LVSTQSFFFFGMVTVLTFFGIDSKSGFEQKGYGFAEAWKQIVAQLTSTIAFFQGSELVIFVWKKKQHCLSFVRSEKKENSHLKKRTQKEPNKRSTPLGKKKLKVTILLRKSKSKLSFLFVSCNNNVTSNFFLSETARGSSRISYTKILPNYSRNF